MVKKALVVMMFIGAAVTLDITCKAQKNKGYTLYKVNSVSDLVALFPTNVAQIDARVAQAFEHAKKSLEQILQVPDEQRTFANTVQALDSLTSLSDLVTVARILSAIKLVSPDTALRTCAQEQILKIEEFFVEHVYNNQALYKAFKYYADHNAANEQLTAEQRYYIDDMLKGFVANGLDLPQEKRQEVIRLKKELSKLEQEFEINIAQDNRTITVDPKDLQGLDQGFIDALAKTEDGMCVLGTDYPTYFNVMENCSVAATRKKLNHLFENRAYPVNYAILEQIIAKRDELAHLLGFASYAHLNLDNSMVGTPERAYAFLQDLLTSATKKTQQEFKMLVQELPEGVELSAQGTIPSWSWAYTKASYKKKHFNVDDYAIAQYFPMEKTVQELLDIYRQFLGVEFKEVAVKGLWHQDVICIEVTSQSGQQLGYLLLDMYPRENKYNHACMSSVIPAVTLEDGTQPTMVSLVVANFPKSTAQKPSLLKLDDVRTFFHEFGHAIHDVLGRTTLGSLAGTSTKRDFVELPSQMLEEWLSDKEILQKVSSHYKTGEPLPEELINRILALKTFDTGDFLQRQVSLSLLSLEYFKDGSHKDLHTIHGDICKQIRTHITYNPEGHFYAAFGHLTGYGAQYYGYMWSKVFALDMFSEIKKHGLLNPQIGQRYITHVIGKGGAQDPNELLVNFLGRQPNSDAFFKDLGLHQQVAQEPVMSNVSESEIAVVS